MATKSWHDMARDGKWIVFSGQNRRAPKTVHISMEKMESTEVFFLMSISFGVNLNSLNLY